MLSQAISSSLEGANYESVLRDLLPLFPPSSQRSCIAYFKTTELKKVQNITDAQVHGLNNDFLISRSAMLNAAQLHDQGFRPYNAVLFLAAAGIDLILPNVSFNSGSIEEISRFKEEYAEERASYLKWIAELSHGACEAFPVEGGHEIERWARNFVEINVAPSAKILEAAIRKADKRRLKTSGFSFWREGLPAILTSGAQGGGASALFTGLVEAIKALNSGAFMEEPEKKFPHLSYIVALKHRR